MSPSPPRVRVAGFPAVLEALAALIVWALHFTVVYAVNAYVCARGLAEARLFGLPASPALATAATALALLAVAVVYLRAARRLPRGPAAREGEDEPRFLAWFTAAAALLSGAAILLEWVPALVIPPCA